MTFINAQEAFEYYYDLILKDGQVKSGTKFLANQGFTLTQPLNNLIQTPWRKWKHDYAEYEWQWYLAGDPNADEIAKRAKIWANMQDEAGNVRSNYGWQWRREGQIDQVVKKLRKDPYTRQAVISIYDGKEIYTYYKDTPCTLSISFQQYAGALNMTVMMRSCDLVYGFCNDQYCFSRLQQYMAKTLFLEVGVYHHFCVDLHIYERHYNLKERNDK
jgi:thymidylate synthase